MQQLPLDHNSQNDPTVSSKIEGVTVTCCGDDMIVYGGWAADRIWRFNLAKATWTEVICSGSIPPAREYHTACYYGGHLIVCGGEMMVEPKHGIPQYLNYYELALDTYEWMSIECYGTIPVNRSHHTAVMCSDSMVVFGGKPADGKNLTNGSLAESKRVGFYDVFVLHVISRTWKRIEMFDPKSPMLWGHSSVCFRDSYVLFFGGFDVSQNDFAGSPFVAGASNSIEAPPVAALSDTVHILNVETWHWSRCTPGEDQPAPVPRAMHLAFTHRVEMIIFGGFTVDVMARCINVNDCWVWNIENGQWRRIEFCIPQWSSKRLLSCVYYDQLVVAHQLSNVFYLDLVQKGTGWQRCACKTNERMVHGKGEGPRIVTDASEGPGKLSTSPQRTNRPMVSVPETSEFHPTGEKITGRRSSPPRQGGGKGHQQPVAQDPRRPFEVPKTLPEGFLSRTEVYEAEVDVLKAEVSRLREQLKERDRSRSASHATPQQPQYQQQQQPYRQGSPQQGAPSNGRGESESKRLAKWEDIAGSYDAQAASRTRAAASGPRATSPAVGSRRHPSPAAGGRPQQPAGTPPRTRKAPTPTRTGRKTPVGQPQRRPVTQPEHRPYPQPDALNSRYDSGKQWFTVPSPDRRRDSSHPMSLSSTNASPSRDLQAREDGFRVSPVLQQFDSAGSNNYNLGRRELQSSPVGEASPAFPSARRLPDPSQFGEVERKRQEINDVKTKKIAALQAKLDAMLQNNQMSSERAAAIRQVMEEVQRAAATAQDELRQKETEKHMLQTLHQAHEDRVIDAKIDENMKQITARRQSLSANSSLMAQKRGSPRSGGKPPRPTEGPADSPVATSATTVVPNAAASPKRPPLFAANDATSTRPIITAAPRFNNPPANPPATPPSSTAPYPSPPRQPSPASENGLESYWKELDAALRQPPRATIP